MQHITPDNRCPECYGPSHPPVVGSCPLLVSQRKETMREYVLAYMLPTPGCLFVTKPEIAANFSGVMRGGIFAPSRGTNMREYGMLARVEKVSVTGDPLLTVGSQILIAEYAGKPIYLKDDTDVWVIGEGDIMAHVKLPINFSLTTSENESEPLEN